MKRVLFACLVCMLGLIWTGLAPAGTPQPVPPNKLFKAMALRPQPEPPDKRRDTKALGSQPEPPDRSRKIKAKVK